MITNELDTKKTGTAPSCHAPEDTAYRWEPGTGHFGLSGLVLNWPGPEKHVQLAHLWPPADMICLLAILDMVHHNDICKNPWNFTMFYLDYFVVVTIPPYLWFYGPSKWWNYCFCPNKDLCWEWISEASHMLLYHMLSPVVLSNSNILCVYLYINSI